MHTAHGMYIETHREKPSQSFKKGTEHTPAASCRN